MTAVPAGTTREDRLVAALMDAVMPVSGLSALEAMRLAAVWWDRHGRGLVAEYVNPDVVRERDAPKVVASGVGPGLILPGDVVNEQPSGILRAVAWDALTIYEQLKIARQWHHDHVLKPNGQADPELGAIEEAREKRERRKARNRRTGGGDAVG